MSKEHVLNLHSWYDNDQFLEEVEENGIQNTPTPNENAHFLTRLALRVVGDDVENQRNTVLQQAIGNVSIIVSSRI